MGMLVAILAPVARAVLARALPEDQGLEDSPCLSDLLPALRA